MRITIIFYVLSIIAVHSANSQFFQTTTRDFAINKQSNVLIDSDRVCLSNEVGTGRDGNLFVGMGSLVYCDSVRTSVVGHSKAGDMSVSVSSTNGFNVDDEIFLINVQDISTDLQVSTAGQYELRKVKAKTPSALILTEALKFGYGKEGVKSVAVKVPHYKDVTIDYEGILTVSPWDGLTGGILVFRSQGIVKVNTLGKIDVTGKGYRGGAGLNRAYSTGFQGEGMTGPGIQSSTPNVNGSGGGEGKNMGLSRCWTSAGGGSYGSTGEKSGSASSCNAGAPGQIIGSESLVRLFMGGGGGSAGISGNGETRPGGCGGGIIFISSKGFEIDGYIKSDGASPFSAGSGEAGWSGSGAGGSIYLVASEKTNVKRERVSAIGGKEYIKGGEGRIRIDAPATEGESIPAYFSQPQLYAYSSLGQMLTPTISKSSQEFWGKISYNARTTPGTDITVDVLHSYGTEIVTGLRNGDNLNWRGVPATVNEIQLRANLSNTHGNYTPVLEDWGLNVTLVAVDEPPTAGNLHLYDPFPNPASKYTTISYNLNVPDYVTITIHDVLGREVASLTDQKYQNNGLHQIPFQFDERLKSGTYFVRMKTRKMALAKTILLNR